MKVIHILNPAAGQGEALKFKNLENAYITKAPGDASDYVQNTLENSDEDINFKVYGGDGTINEVVTGIVRSSSQRGYMSVMPTGTGNDLIRTVTAEGINEIDVLTMNDKFAVNAINTGFDLEVVQKAAEFKKKPFISGSLAYILGIISALTNKFGKMLTIDYVDKNGTEKTYKGECLLVVAANGCYYGGGFKASPSADVTDGLIDLMIVKKVSRFRFISLVGAYKKGLHITKKGIVQDKFKDIVTFCKCKKVTINGMSEICADGEIFKQTKATIGILPKSLKLIVGQKEPVTI